MAWLKSVERESSKRIQPLLLSMAKGRRGRKYRVLRAKPQKGVI